jgi:hypothetical protein
MAEVHGNRTMAENAGKTVVLPESGAESGALSTDSAENDPGLRLIIERWPELPDALQADILSLVRAAAS